MLDGGATQHEILANLARTLPVRSYLEIGVRDGCTLWVVYEACKDRLTHLALCDDWGPNDGGTDRGNHAHISELLRVLGFVGKIKWLDGKSQHMIPPLGANFVFDLVHIDGDHSYDGAIADMRNCWPRCMGAMVIHDTAMLDEVRKAVQDFAAESSVHPAFFHGGNGSAVIIRDGVTW